MMNQDEMDKWVADLNQKTADAKLRIDTMISENERKLTNLKHLSILLWRPHEGTC